MTSVNLQWFLLDISSGFPAKIRQLSSLEYDEIVIANLAMNDLMFYLRKINETEYNYDDLLATIDKYSISYSSITDSGYDQNLMDESLINVNRTFTNFISSLITFVENIEKRRYHQKPEKYNPFKAGMRNIHSNYFSYRLFYSLRNYALHYKFPLDIIGKLTQRSKSERSIYIEGCEIFFNRDKILEGNFIRSELRKELLRDYNDTFPLNPSLIQISKAFKKIIEEFLKIEKNDFEKHSEKLMTFVKESSQVEHVAYGIIHLMKKSGMQPCY